MTAAVDLERELNLQQIEAVTHGNGPQLVIAGAGSGKTRVITYRIAWLIGELGVSPGAITAVTFTNKAAAEMRERVEGLVDQWPLETFVGTFHRWALIQLRRYGERVGLARNFAILDTSDQLNLIKQALQIEGLSEKSFPPRGVLATISSAKNRLIDPDAFEDAADSFFARRVAPCYRRYQGLLAKASGVDFDDMLFLAVRLMEQEPDVLDRLRYRAQYLLVDEYQDTNQAQQRLIEVLAGEPANLTAVGDEDQGIYRWRGADIANILDFERHFPGTEVRKLEQNYRSTQTILDASGALVANNQGRRGKRLWTDSGEGENIVVFKATDEQEEARWLVQGLSDLRSKVPLSEMAILVRTNAQTRSIEDELLRREIPYILVGGTRFYERAEIKDLVAYLRLLRNPQDSYSLERILNRPARGIGKATQEMLRQEADSLGQPLWDVIFQRQTQNLPTRAATAVGKFRDLIAGLMAAAEELPLPALLDRLLEDTRFLDMYRPDHPEDAGRIENIREFLSAAQEFTESRAFNSDDEDLLTPFLDHVALVADLDDWEVERGISVMTLHSAKGLEFTAVVVAGLEDGLLPHFNSQGTRDDLEEERRLLYVGMTRARRHLSLTNCRRRRIAGRYQDQRESPFLAEIPEELLDIQQSPSLFTPGGSADSVSSFFGRAPRTTEEPSLDESFSQESRQIRRGSRVRHPTLGEGTVLSLEGQGDHTKLTVYFPKAGKRKLVARYANLELL
ncbi:MAG: UvrD-helicase domain-containing protein [Acidobacteriota bacterium]